MWITWEPDDDLEGERNEGMAWKSDLLGEKMDRFGVTIDVPVFSS